MSMFLALKTPQKYLKNTEGFGGTAGLYIYIGYATVVVSGRAIMAPWPECQPGR